MSGAPTPKPINNDLRNREAIEVLAGFRPPERMHAVRKGDIGDIQAYVDAIRAAVSAAEARLIAFASNIAAQQADLAQLNADVQAALAELGDLQASLPGGALGTMATQNASAVAITGGTIARQVIFTGVVGETLTPANNGDICIEFTNNTTITLKGKGGGVVRSIALTIA